MIFHVFLKDCIEDIKLAIKLDYPKSLRYKLCIRAAQCYIKLGKKRAAEEAIVQAHEIINEFIVPGEKKGKCLFDIVVKTMTTCKESFYLLCEKNI